MYNAESPKFLGQKQAATMWKWVERKTTRRWYRMQQSGAEAEAEAEASAFYLDRQTRHKRY